MSQQGYTLHAGDRWELRASIPRNLGEERDFYLCVFTGDVSDEETLQDPGYVSNRGYYLLARGLQGKYIRTMKTV